MAGDGRAYALRLYDGAGDGGAYAIRPYVLILMGTMHILAIVAFAGRSWQSLAYGRIAFARIAHRPHRFALKSMLLLPGYAIHRDHRCSSLPSAWIRGDIPPDAIKIRVVADDMLVIIALPYARADCACQQVGLFRCGGFEPTHDRAKRV
jgi:hypothetical protein